MKENLYTPNSIRAASGKYLDITNIDPDQIDIMDIAYSLSRKIRFNGHMRVDYTVAEHCINVVGRVHDENKLAALLHDASEAYLGDIPGPYKKLFPQYQVYEDSLMKVIAEKYGFQYPFVEEIKKADKDVLEFEWHRGVLSEEMAPLAERQAFWKFMDLFGKHKIQ